MIRSMVARLESRLESEPGDVEGWVRLARSKAVLGDRDAAVAALEKGLAANPGAPPARTRPARASRGRVSPQSGPFPAPGHLPTSHGPAASLPSSSRQRPRERLGFV